MKEIIYFGLDLINYGILGILLADLLEKMLTKRFCFHGSHRTGELICLQFVLLKLFLSQSELVKQLLYGEDMYMQSSRQSIIPVAGSMLFTLVWGGILYKSGWVRLLSLVTAFYAFMELVRFTLYSFAMRVIESVIGCYSKWYLSGEIVDEKTYEQLISMTEIVWNLVLTAAVLFLFGICLRQYKKYLIPGEGKWQQSEAALLLVPGITGLLLGMMLRSILFYHREGEIYNIVEEYPEMNVMIPCMSLLCTISLILSARLLFQVTKEHEKRKQAEVYRNQVSQMEVHIREMESVYDGIRGMKHDMKNYMADIRALLSQAGTDGGEEQNVLTGYVDSLQSTLERLDANIQTGHPVTDVILSRGQKLAAENEIVFDCEFLYPKGLGIDAFDLGIILNNALENALEACQRANTEKTFMELKANRKSNMFLIQMKNSFNGQLKLSSTGRLESTKEEMNHGFGLKNIQSCAEKYYGKAEIKAEQDVFYLTVMLQGRIDDINPSVHYNSLEFEPENGDTYHNRI